MITLLHGDDTASSRLSYKNLQQGENIIFDGEKMSSDQLENSVQSLGLFADVKTICIENLLSKRKPSKELETIIQILETASQHSIILLWEGKQLTKKQTIFFSKSTVKEFSFPKTLFSFLEALYPQNSSTLFQLYHQTLQTVNAEMILVMIIRQIRMLLALSDNTSETIPETATLAYWQQKKLVNQVSQFSQEQLLELHKALFEIEVKSKTGGLALPLSQTIDFFLTAI